MQAVMQLLNGRLGPVIRFAFVGGSAFLVDAGVLYAMIAVGLGPIAGRVVSIACAVTFTWWLNRSFTFKAAAPPTWHEFARYVGTSLVAMVINYAIYAGLVALGMIPLLALAIATLVSSVFNYLRYSKLFGARSEAALDPAPVDGPSQRR